MLQRHARTIDGIAITVRALDGNYARAPMPIASMNEAIRDSRRPACEQLGALFRLLTAGNCAKMNRAPERRLLRPVPIEAGHSAVGARVSLVISVPVLESSSRGGDAK